VSSARGHRSPKGGGRFPSATFATVRAVATTRSRGCSASKRNLCLIVEPLGVRRPGDPNVVGANRHFGVAQLFLREPVS
jgi:hypothetical protein